MDRTFIEKVLAVVAKIPRGKVMSYGEVAAAAGSPGAARAVGNIMMNNTDKNIPCHRVVNADGSIGGYNTLRGPSKRQLLLREGVELK
jgi:O-6-methylguanine DNA methyltransferase